MFSCHHIIFTSILLLATPMPSYIAFTNANAIAKTSRQGAQICQPHFPLLPLPLPPPLDALLGDLGLSTGRGFEVCLFNSTGNLVTDLLGVVGNTVWSLQNLGGFIAGSCFCRQDCTPSQIVCEDATILESLFPGMEFNILNGIAQFVYQAEMWQFFCYCPEFIENGVDPCIRPQNPQVCPAP